MTCASMESRLVRSRRDSSRSTSLRAASGSSRCVQPLAQLLDVAVLVLLTQLLADRLHLLAQKHLPLALAQLLLDLGLDVLLGVEHADLPLHSHQHAAQPFLDSQSFEQRLALGRLELDMTRHEIRQPARIGDVLPGPVLRPLREVRTSVPARQPARAPHGTALRRRDPGRQSGEGQARPAPRRSDNHRLPCSGRPCCVALHGGAVGRRSRPR